MNMDMDKNMDLDVESRMLMAISPRATPNELDEFANDRSMCVRWAAANNQKTHPLALNRLARDPDASVRFAAVINPNTPRTTVQYRASFDPDSRVRAAANSILQAE